jgi:hypothetical protein
MKTLKILLVLVAVILSGFSTESREHETGVVKPMKFDGVIITNPSSGATVCTPAGDPYPYIAHARTGWLQGNQTHGGKLITERSTWEISSCSTDFTTGLNTSQITGVNTVANGDSYTFTCTMIVNIFTNDVILNINFTGGVGKFEGVTGQMSLTGIHTESGIPVKGEGFMSFPK